MTRVVAGILRQGGAILACRRRLDDAFGGKWEFPGGKIRKTESAPDALVRELQEELGIHVAPGPEVDCIRHQYNGHPQVEIRFFEIASFQNEPENLNFEELRWMTPDALPSLDWLDADWPLVRRLASSDGQPLPPHATPPGTQRG
jgi:8-oxo-dGTP diphosphatase